jgi:excisionase family DNA binding protein
VSVETRPEEEAERLLTPHELSGLLGLGRTRTYSLLISGEIPSVRIGRLRRVRRSDVEKFVESHMECADG